MTAASTPKPRPRKKVATARSRAVAAAVSALAFFGIGAAIGARATSVTTASGPVTTARVANPAPATSWVWVRSSENDDEGGRDRRDLGRDPRHDDGAAGLGHAGRPHHDERWQHPGGAVMPRSQKPGSARWGQRRT